MFIFLPLKLYDVFFKIGTKTYLTNMRPNVFYLYKMINLNYKYIHLFFICLFYALIWLHLNEIIQTLNNKIKLSIFFIELVIILGSIFYYGTLIITLAYSTNTIAFYYDAFLVYFFIFNILFGIPSLCFCICYNSLWGKLQKIPLN
jgi:hypothetical protein